MNRTQIVSEYIASAVSTELAADVAELGRCHLLDTLAAIVACRDLDAAVVARRYVSRWGGADRDRSATIAGTRDRAPVVDAAFAGAMTGHAAEINDFIPSVFVQPGPAIVATALAIGEVRGASGMEVLRATVAGYEVAARIIRALGAGNLRRAGVANHGVGPCFGAAAAASALLGLSANEVAHVLSLTAQQAGGSWQWLLDVEHVEKAFVFAGLGARNGTHAALLVEAGFRGVPDVVDRPGTWFTSAPFSDPDGDGDLDELTRDLGSDSVLADVAYKRYPVGGPTQPAVEALLALQPSIAVRQVEHVTIEMPGRFQAFRDAHMPALNLRYLAAIILLDGHLDFLAAQSLHRMHNDESVQELMARVEVRHDPKQEAASGLPRTESARVTIHRTSGEPASTFVPHVLGFPSHPMTPQDVEEKARELVVPQLGRDRAELLIEATRDPAAISAAKLVAQLSPHD